MPAPTRPRIVVIGSTMIDLMAYAARIPTGGETVIGQAFSMGFGGKGANQAIMASLLGAEVAMVNRLGRDVFGPMTIENLDRFGVDTSHVALVEGASSGAAEVWVEPGGANRIIVVPGANMCLTAAEAASAVGSLPPANVALGQLEIPQASTAAGFRAARARGAITVLNPGPAQPLEAELLAATDWLIPNEVEFAMLADDDGLADDDLARYAGAVEKRLAVTLGDAGAALVGADGTVTRIPAEPVVAVDTTGAGDAFVAGFAVGLASGLGEAGAVRLGVICGSDSVTRPGTQASYVVPARAMAMLGRSAAAT
jgi:ribokinase